MGSMLGMAGSGRTVGVRISTRTRAVPLITLERYELAVTKATFTRMFRKRRWFHTQLIHTIYTAAGTEASIAIIHPGLGNETPAQLGTPHRKYREPTFNNTPSAAAWANNGSTTSVRLAVGFRALRVELPILAEELISAAAATDELT